MNLADFSTPRITQGEHNFSLIYLGVTVPLKGAKQFLWQVFNFSRLQHISQPDPELCKACVELLGLIFERGSQGDSWLQAGFFLRKIADEMGTAAISRSKERALLALRDGPDEEWGGQTFRLAFQSIILLMKEILHQLLGMLSVIPLFTGFIPYVDGLCLNQGLLVWFWLKDLASVANSALRRLWQNSSVEIHSYALVGSWFYDSTTIGVSKSWCATGIWSHWKGAKKLRWPERDRGEIEFLNYIWQACIVAALALLDQGHSMAFMNKNISNISKHMEHIQTHVVSVNF